MEQNFKVMFDMMDCKRDYMITGNGRIVKRTEKERAEGPAQEVTQPVSSVTIACWNINGWTQNNAIIRQTVIQNMKTDIVCVTETHCSNNIDNQPFVSGYMWFGHSRQA